MMTTICKKFVAHFWVRHKCVHCKRKKADHHQHGLQETSPLTLSQQSSLGSATSTSRNSQNDPLKLIRSNRKYCSYSQHLWKTNTCRHCGNNEQWHLDVQPALLATEMNIDFNKLRSARPDALPDKEEEATAAAAAAAKDDDNEANGPAAATKSKTEAVAAAGIACFSATGTTMGPTNAKANANASPSASAAASAAEPKQQQPLIQERKQDKHVIVCSVCMEDIPYDDPEEFFWCPASEHHSQCALCFGDYVLHCCESFMDESKFPIGCPAPGCDHTVSDVRIRDIIERDTTRGAAIWHVYQTFQVKAGLISFRDLVPMTCPSCNIYSELLPRDYQRRAHKAKNELMGIDSEDEEEEEEEEGEESSGGNAAPPDEQQPTALLSTGLAPTGGGHKNQEENPHTPLIELFKEYFNDLLVDPKLAAEAAKKTTRKEPGSPKSGGFFSFLRRTPSPPKHEPVSASVLAAQRQYDSYSALRRRVQELLESSKHSAEGAGAAAHSIAATNQPVATSGVTAAGCCTNEENKEEKEEKVADAAFSMAARAVLDAIPPPLQLKRQVSEFSHNFFVCKTWYCDYSHCLLCDKEVKRSETNEHNCVVSKEVELYHTMNGILAEASARQCPQCKRPGLKDLACTHISCDTCKIRWCYVCATKPTDFSKHNNPFKIVSANAPPEQRKCPMYLKAKYGGEGFNNGCYSKGSPKLALDRFHTELQIRAVCKFVRGLKRRDKAAWKRMMRSRYPQGIWDANILRDLFEMDYIAEHLGEYNDLLTQMKRFHNTLTALQSIGASMDRLDSRWVGSQKDLKEFRERLAEVQGRIDAANAATDEQKTKDKGSEPQKAADASVDTVSEETGGPSNGIPAAPPFSGWSNATLLHIDRSVGVRDTSHGAWGNSDKRRRLYLEQKIRAEECEQLGMLTSFASEKANFDMKVLEYNALVKTHGDIEKRIRSFTDGNTVMSALFRKRGVKLKSNLTKFSPKEIIARRSGAQQIGTTKPQWKRGRAGLLQSIQARPQLRAAPQVPAVPQQHLQQLRREFLPQPPQQQIQQQIQRQGQNEDMRQLLQAPLPPPPQ